VHLYGTKSDMVAARQGSSPPGMHVRMRLELVDATGHRVAVFRGEGRRSGRCCPSVAFRPTATGALAVDRGQTSLAKSGHRSAAMTRQRGARTARVDADTRRSLRGRERAGAGALSRGCCTERDEPHEEEACAELEVHVTARRNEAALAEDRDRFYRLLQRE